MSLDLDALFDRFADLVADKLAAKLASANGGAGNGDAPAEPDKLLSADEAAARLGVTRRWIYGHAKELPFVVRPGSKQRMMRFSEQGIARWIVKRQGR